MKNLSLRSSIFHLLFVIVAVALYFLNNNRTSAFNEALLNNILSAFTLVIIVLVVLGYLYGFIKIDNTDAILITGLIVSVLLTIFFRKYVSVHFVYLLAGYYVVRSGVQLNAFLLKVLLYAIFASICLQLAILRFDGRPVLTYNDPNYSGFYIFIFFLLSFKKGYLKLAIIIGVLGFLTLSRNYLLAISTFTICSTGIMKTVISKLRLLNFYAIFIIGVTVPLLVGAYFLQNIAGNYQNANNGIYDNTSSRLLDFKDRSNEDRFLANALFLADFGTNTKRYIWGRDLKTYIDNVFMNSPHNSFFQLILNYGIVFAFFYLLLFGKIINQCMIRENIPYLFSMLIYFTFLGGGIYGIQVIFIFFILNEKQAKLSGVQD
jgi:hypothetical protein